MRKIVFIIAIFFTTNAFAGGAVPKITPCGPGGVIFGCEGTGSLLGGFVKPKPPEKKNKSDRILSILDYDPDKQDFIQLCCERKPNPKSPMEYLPPPTAF